MWSRDRKMSMFARVRGSSASNAAFPEGLMWCQSSHKYRILLVDEDVEFQYQLRSWLFPRFEVFSLLNLSSAMKGALEFRADIIILHGSADASRNTELLRRLQHQRALVGLPIVWLSHATHVDRHHLMDKVHEILASPPPPPDHSEPIH